MKKQNRIICAGALAITVFAVSLAGCAGGSTSSAAAESGAGASSSGGTTYVGKVTAITGNQVELALGTVEGGQGGPGGEPNTSGGPAVDRSKRRPQVRVTLPARCSRLHNPGMLRVLHSPPPALKTENERFRLP